MAPSAAAFVHLPAQELHPDCLQLPHRGGEIVDQEADHGTGGEVLVVLVAQGRTLGEMPPGAGYSLCPGAYPTNALDPHPCRSPAQELGVRDPATSQLAVLGSSLGRAGAAG
jgi:hypothetical protein